MNVPAAVLLALASLSVACTSTTSAPPPAGNATSRPPTAARPAKPGRPAPAVPSSRPVSGSGTHCRRDEHIVFSCEVEGGDGVASLCLSKGDAVARYASGPLARPTLLHSHGFERTSLTYAGGTGGYGYSFRLADRTLVLYAISGENPLRRAGILQTNADATAAILDRPCDPRTVVESDDPAVIGQTRTWPSNARLARHGLPATP